MKEITQLKADFFDLLNERQKRLYAGLEAISIGHYGVSQVSETFDIHPNTVRQGKKDLRTIQNSSLDKTQIRQSGGGRKKNQHESP